MRLFSLILLSTGLFVIACRPGRDATQNTTPPQPSVQAVDTTEKYIIQLVQRDPRQPGGGWFIAVRTEADMPCANYTINHDFQNQSGRMVLTIKENVRPEICLTALGPASCVVSLGQTVVAGRYDFSVILPTNDPVRGRLTSDGTQVQLTMSQHPRLRQEVSPQE